MFGNNLFTSLSKTSSSAFSLSKILGGANKTLIFVNKALPLYYQIKPMMNNAKTILNMYGKISDDKTSEEKNDLKQIKNSIKTKKEKYKNDTLSFFQ